MSISHHVQESLSRNRTSGHNNQRNPRPRKPQFKRRRRRRSLNLIGERQRNDQQQKMNVQLRAMKENTTTITTTTNEIIRGKTVIFGVLIVVCMAQIALAFPGVNSSPSSLRPLDPIAPMESPHGRQQSGHQVTSSPELWEQEVREQNSSGAHKQEGEVIPATRIAEGITIKSQEFRQPMEQLTETYTSQLDDISARGSSTTQRRMINGASGGHTLLQLVSQRDNQQEQRSDIRRERKDGGRLNGSDMDRRLNETYSGLLGPSRELARTARDVQGERSDLAARESNGSEQDTRRRVTYDDDGKGERRVRPLRSQQDDDTELAGEVGGMVSVLASASATAPSVAPVKDEAREHDLHEQDFEKRLMEWKQKYEANRAISDKAYYILLVIYSLFIIVGTVSNSLICLTVILKPQILSPRNIFIVNLAGSDLLLCVFTMPFSFIEISMKMWQMGLIPCKLVAGLQATSIFVSTISITAIALDRYKVIVYPTHQETHGSTRRAVLLLASVWFGALLLSSPLFQFRTVTHVNVKLPSVAHKYGTSIKAIDFCIEDWPLTHGRGIYSVISMMFQYVLPITIVSVVYAKISDKLQKRLIRRQRLTQLECQQKRQLNLIRRTHTMLISVSLIFGLSWLPLNLLNVVGDFTDLFKGDDQLFRIVFAICHLIGCSSACSNPVLYGYLNENFRKEFHQVYTHHVRRLMRLLRIRPSSSGGGSPYMAPNASSTASSSSVASSGAERDEETREPNEDDDGEESDIDEDDDDDDEEEEEAEDMGHRHGRHHHQAQLRNHESAVNRPNGRSHSNMSSPSGYVVGPSGGSAASGNKRCSSALASYGHTSIAAPRTLPPLPPAAVAATSCQHLFPLLAISHCSTSAVSSKPPPRENQAPEPRGLGHQTNKPGRDDDHNNKGPRSTMYQNATTNMTMRTGTTKMKKPASCVLEVGADGASQFECDSIVSGLACSVGGGGGLRVDDEMATRRCSFQTTTSSGRQPLGLTMKFCLCLSGTSSTETLGGGGGHNHLQNQPQNGQENNALQQSDNSPLNHHQSPNNDIQHCEAGVRPSIRVEQLYSADMEASSEGRQQTKLAEDEQRPKRKKGRQWRRKWSRHAATPCECQCHDQDTTVSLEKGAASAAKLKGPRSPTSSARGSNRARLSDGSALFGRGKIASDNTAGPPDRTAPSMGPLAALKQGRRVWLRFLPVAGAKADRQPSMATAARSQPAEFQEDQASTGGSRIRPKLSSSSQGPAVDASTKGNEGLEPSRVRGSIGSLLGGSGAVCAPSVGGSIGNHSGPTKKPWSQVAGKQQETTSGKVATGRGQFCKHCASNCKQQVGSNSDQRKQSRKRPKHQFRGNDSKRSEKSRASWRRKGPAIADKPPIGIVEGIELEPLTRPEASDGGAKRLFAGTCYLSIETARSSKGRGGKRGSEISEGKSTSVFVLGASDDFEDSITAKVSASSKAGNVVPTPNQEMQPPIPTSCSSLVSSNHYTNNNADETTMRINNRPVDDCYVFKANDLIENQAGEQQAYSMQMRTMRANQRVDEEHEENDTIARPMGRPVMCPSSTMTLPSNSWSLKRAGGDSLIKGSNSIADINDNHDDDRLPPSPPTQITASQSATFPKPLASLKSADQGGTVSRRANNSLQRNCAFGHLSSDHVPIKRPSQLLMTNTMTTTCFSAPGTTNNASIGSVTMTSAPTAITKTTLKMPNSTTTNEQGHQQQMDSLSEGQVNDRCSARPNDYICFRSHLSASSGSSGTSCTCSSSSVSSTVSSSCHLNSASNQTTHSIRSPTICSSLAALAGSIVQLSATHPLRTKATCGPRSSCSAATRTSPSSLSEFGCLSGSAGPTSPSKTDSSSLRSSASMEVACLMAGGQQSSVRCKSGTYCERRPSSPTIPNPISKAPVEETPETNHSTAPITSASHRVHQSWCNGLKNNQTISHQQATQVANRAKLARRPETLQTSFKDAN